MEIVINHLTRMQPGYMCAAGVELRTRRHVRPSVQKGRLTTSHLSVNGGPFDIGNRVEIGRARPLKRRPQVEDCSYNPGAATARGVMPHAEFWQLLDKLCKPTLTAIFGPELRRVGSKGCGTDEGRGRASLGCMRPQRKPRIYLRERPERRTQIRISFTDGEFRVDGSLTDIRLYQDDHVTPDRRAVQKLSHAIKQSRDMILCVGLTRAWSSAPDLCPVHWVQVNNVHLRESPVRPLDTLEEDEVTERRSEAPGVTDYSREARKRGLTFREYLKSLYE